MIPSPDTGSADTVQKRARLENKLVRDPQHFDDNDQRELVELLSEHIDDLTQLSRRVFDINKGTLLNKSDAEVGLTGRLNARSQRRRRKRYYRKIYSGFRERESNKIILAEGDSWFEFPVFLRDIVDWLGRREDYAVFSLAKGSDWLSNMIYQGEYIEELPIHSPDAFLISGGGNDLVGGNRVAIMVLDPVKNGPAEPTSQDVATLEAAQLGDVDSSEIMNGMRYLSREFFAFLNILRIQYHLMFTNLNKVEKYRKMRIITQGYDYPIPSNRIHFGTNLKYFYQPILNLAVGNGLWLKRPLMLKGIIDEQLQRTVMKAMIFFYNDTLIKVGQGFDNVYHVDCRGLIRRKDWFDELHPKSYAFKRIARAYAFIIDEEVLQSKVVQAVDF